jgi:hypothetical protein
MKEIKYEKADGSEGSTFVLEAGDKVIAKFSAPRKNEKGIYDSYSLGVEGNNSDETAYVRLSKGQGEKLLKLGDLTGKTIVAYEYSNKFGKFIGVKVDILAVKSALAKNNKK